MKKRKTKCIGILTSGGDCPGLNAAIRGVAKTAHEIQRKAEIDVRSTTLGHVQRGGPPTATDRLLSTRLGAKAGELLANREYNVMIGVRGEECVSVPLQDVAGKTKIIPKDHPWLRTALAVGSCLGNQL